MKITKKLSIKKFMKNNNIVFKKDVVLFLEEQDDCSADLIIADPPYNISEDCYRIK